MTDKPIIIDGVDVSNCEFNYIEMFAEHYGCNLYPPELNCKYHPNCYYKQLARKTQECEGIRKERNKFKSQYRKNRVDRKQAEKKLEKIENYIKKYAGLYFDEIVQAEILQIIDEVE